VGGDSPAYLLRGNTLTKITRDHSLVQDLVESGIISETEATNHPQANVITRAVGADADALNLDKRTGRLVLGDRLLLCSDGLSKTLSNERLASCFWQRGHQRRAPVMAALEAQAIDNVTAVIIDFDADDGSTTLQASPSSVPASAAAEASAGSSAMSTVGQPMTMAPRGRIASRAGRRHAAISVVKDPRAITSGGRHRPTCRRRALPACRRSAWYGAGRQDGPPTCGTRR